MATNISNNIKKQTGTYPLGKLFIYALLWVFLLGYFYRIREMDDFFLHLQLVGSGGWRDAFLPYAADHVHYPNPLWHILVYYMAKLTDFSFATMGTIVSAACVVSSIALLDHYLRKYITAPTVFGEKALFGLAIGLNAATALYIPPHSPYVTLFSGQPWHSPTYLLMRPFAIACFFIYYELFTERLDDGRIFGKIKKKDGKIVLFGLLAFISILAKPSFVFLFGPPAIVFALIQIIQSPQKGQLLLIVGKIGILMVPSLIILLLQHSALSGEDGFLIFAPLRVWKLHRQMRFLVSFAAAYAFPLFSGLVLFKFVFKNKLLFLSVLTGLTGILEFALFAEEGARLFDANLSWGQMCGTLLLFAGCLIAFANHWQNAEIKRRNAWLFYGGELLLFLHIASGIYYWYVTFNGVSHLSLNFY
jgi:hypothetical protein